MEELKNTIDTLEKKDEECIELKNIKYKSALFNKNNNNNKETILINNISKLDLFLENDTNNNKNEPWCKLNNITKIQKLLDYVNFYKKENKLNEDEELLLINFLKDCINRKKLQKEKDVIYDKNTGIIKEIPALLYTKVNKRFTLKNIDKRISTLKSLPPKKTNTIKNKIGIQILENDIN